MPAESLTALDVAPEDLFMVDEDIMTLCRPRDLASQRRRRYMFEVKAMLSVLGREPNDSLCTVYWTVVRLNDCFLRCQHAAVGLKIDLSRQAAEPWVLTTLDLLLYEMVGQLKFVCTKKGLMNVKTAKERRASEEGRRE